MRGEEEQASITRERQKGSADYGKRSPSGERFMSHDCYIGRKEFEDTMVCHTI